MTWQAISALATLAAVAVALFREDLRFWDRPRLTASLPPGPPAFQKARKVLYHSDGGVRASGPCYCVRLRVENVGRRAAENVQVYVERLLRRGMHGGFGGQPGFVPMNLRWSHDGVVYAERISPRMPRYCDVCSFDHPKLSATGPTRLELAVEVAPLTGSHLLEPGTYRLELRIAAENAEPTTATLEIDFTGGWTDLEDLMFREVFQARLLA